MKRDMIPLQSTSILWLFQQNNRQSLLALAERLTRDYEMNNHGWKGKILPLTENDLNSKNLKNVE